MSVIFKRTKILATLGPATDSYEMIEKLARVGVNSFRLNCSHGDDNQRSNHIKWVRQASKSLNKPLAILLDLQGPKIRLGDLTDKVSVKKGDELVLSFGAQHTSSTIPVQYNLADIMKVGERLFICDGLIQTVVTEKIDDSSIKILVKNDGVLSSHKGINIPDTHFVGNVLTDKDIKDIQFGLRNDIDYIALSFVHSADDIDKLRKILNYLNSDIQIIAKIETSSAASDEKLEEIIKASDGAMVARGDLSSEIGPELVPIVQRKIISLCRKHGRFSIVATQMMVSMCKEPVPTRAEVSDIATAVIQGSDVVMLSDETTVGEYPVETVTAMKKVIMYTQDNSQVEEMDIEIENNDKFRGAIGRAAVDLAERMGAAAIIVDTKSGAMAASISAYRPNLAIASVSSSARTAQQLCLRYASRNYVRADGPSVGEDLAKEIKQQGLCGDGPAIFVIVSGRQPCVTGTTDTIKVIEIT